ncbi:MAG TPA: radical SAM protein, partial [Patescibacteria group bacterium]|nr:radical SAM protein [Patescibacteria group bacterium]
MEKLSLIDYPGELAAVIFTQGCNFRCPFCHNPMLVQASSGAGKIKNTQNRDEQEGHSYISKNDLLDFLKSRSGKLDGVVVTGGEPTVHADIGDFLQEI